VKIKMAITLIKYFLKSNGNINKGIPEMSARLADSVLETSISEPIESLFKLIEEFPHLKNEGLTTKALNLKYNIKNDLPIGKLYDDMYLRTAILDINHRFLKPYEFVKHDSEAQDIVENLRNTLRSL
jgi:hypothetical protein